MKTRYILLLILINGLTACGQFGKLYLPEPAPPPASHANEEPTTL